MKICLATIHLKEAFTPLALLYLKTCLVERRGHQPDNVKILEFARRAQPEDVVREILATEPELLGLSCYVWNIKALLAVAQRVKELRPGIKIVIGGPEVGPRAQEVLESHPCIDIVVKAEGETPLAEIVEALSANRAVADVKGICCRASEKIVDTGNAAIVQDLNRLPSPHLSPYADYSGRIICIETQRGCVFRCNFCFYNKDFSIRNRRFDLDRVKEEILFWLQHDVQEIYLMDPVFNLNPARAKELCRFVIEHNHRKTSFHAEVWAEFIDEEMARLFHEANFQFLEVGLQTTDEAVLTSVERRLKLQPFIDGIRHLRVFRLKFELQLIYGLPGETVESFKRSLNFAAGLDPHFLAVFPLMVLPGTELWRKSEALGLEFSPEPPYYIQSHLTMDSADIAYGWKIVEALKHLAHLRTVRTLSKEPGVTFAEIVDEWIGMQDDEIGRTTTPGPEQVKEFVLRFCARRRIPDEFYRASVVHDFRVRAEPLAAVGA